MERHNVEILGIVLTFSKRLRRVRIQNVFRLRRPDGTKYIAIQGTVDRKVVFPFARVVSAFETCYVQQIVKIWVRETRQVEAVYYQLQRLASPRFIGVPGRWQWWAQR